MTANSGPNEQSALPATIPNVNIDFSISKEDIVAIAVAKHEAHLLAEKDRITAEIKAQEKIMRASEKNKNAKIEEVVKAATTERISQLNAQLADFDAKVSYSVGNHHQDKIEYTISVQANAGNRGSSNNYRGILYKTVEMDKPAEVIGFETAYEEAREKVNELTEQSLEVRKNLSRLASTERQARAVLAENVLSRTDEGKAFLEKLSSDGTLQLPVFDA